MRRIKGALSVLILVVGDLVAVLVSFILGYLFRALLSGNGLSGGVAPETLFSRVYFLLLYPFVFVYEGLYTKRLQVWEERRRCLRGVIVASALLTIVLFMVRLWIVSRFVVLLAMVLGIVLVPLVRTVLKRLLVRVGFFNQPLIIVGDPHAEEMFNRELQVHQTLGYSVVQRLGRKDENETVEMLLARADIPDGALMVVMSQSFSPEELKKIFRYAEEHCAELMVVPDASLLATSAAELEQVGSLLVLKYHYNLLRPLNIWTKQIFEFVFGLILMILFLPLFLILSLLVKISSPGPVLFRQKRIGKAGRTFTCFKFRTMYQDAENRLKELLEKNPIKRAEWERFRKIVDDPRITPVGKFLRRFSLDELPQLINVLKGEMAIVGPRPYLPEEVHRVGDYIKTIVRVRPGLTGLWQVSGRSELPMRDRVLLDEFYIRNWSLWLDFSIVIRTIKAVLTGRGAY
ncbi:MAG: undecaprenyl-phosphate galactose phosphotransferase WbaP [candidate division WOR-3 bacterium]|nr:undecaprenyl-phosphate galactose phosphotransferase WbaP [candidate division WOR-3 bacterium]